MKPIGKTLNQITLAQIKAELPSPKTPDEIEFRDSIARDKKAGNYNRNSYCDCYSGRSAGKCCYPI